MISKKNVRVAASELSPFGVGTSTIKKVYIQSGFNSRLQHIFLKSKHLNALNINFKKNYISGKELKNVLNDFKIFKKNLKLSSGNKNI